MLKDERYDKILDILDNEKYISTQNLAERLFVSMPTIRRDLAYLERKKQVVRNHGGARKVNDEYMAIPVEFRETLNQNEKKRICEAASKLIKDDSIVFLDGSTTALRIAEFISPKQNLTVITNGIPISLMLTKKGIKTYSTCGALLESSMVYAGSFAEEFISKFNFDICFFSSQGVNENGVIVDNSLPETQLRKAAISQSDQSVFLCDKTKFNITARYNLMPACDIDYIVTNCDSPKSFLNREGVIFIK